MSSESCRMLVEDYEFISPSESTFRQYFWKFKNHTFDFEDNERKGALIKLEDDDLEAILHEDPCKVKHH